MVDTVEVEKKDEMVETANLVNTADRVKVEKKVEIVETLKLTIVNTVKMTRTV